MSYILTGRRGRESHFDWDDYVGGLVTKCENVEDWQDFKETSLPDRFRPERIYAKNPNNQVKNLKDIKDLTPDTKGIKGSKDNTKDESDIKDEEGGEKSKNKQRAKTAEEKAVEEKSVVPVRSRSACSVYTGTGNTDIKNDGSVSRSKTLRGISENGHGRTESDKVKDVNDDIKDKDNDGDDDKYRENDNYVENNKIELRPLKERITQSGKSSSQSSITNGVQEKKGAKPKPTIKLSYSQANISLKSKTRTDSGVSSEGSHPSNEDSRTSLKRAAIHAGITSTDVSNKDYFLTALRKFSLPASKDDVHDEEEDDEPLISLVRKPMPGLTVSSIKSSRKLNASATPSLSDSDKSSQKSMTLVTKTLTLEDSACKPPLLGHNIPVLNRERSPRPLLTRPESQTSNRTVCTISIDSSYLSKFAQNTNNSSNGLKPNEIAEGMESYFNSYYQDKRSSSASYFPIADLLPAVEKSIHNSMHTSRAPLDLDYNGEAEEGEEDSDDYNRGCERDITVMASKDGLLPYEESLLMMREGVDLLRLKERNQTVRL